MVRHDLRDMVACVPTLCMHGSKTRNVRCLLEAGCQAMSDIVTTATHTHTESDTTFVLRFFFGAERETHRHMRHVQARAFDEAIMFTGAQVQCRVPYRKLGGILVLVGVLVEVASELGGVLVLVGVLVKVTGELGGILELVGVLVKVASELGGVFIIVGVVSQVALNEVELARTAE